MLFNPQLINAWGSMSLLPVETKILIPNPELTELLSSNLSLKELAETWLSLGQEYSIELGNGLNDG